MPAHISHAIMAKDLYNKMKKDNDLLKIDIFQNELQIELTRKVGVKPW